MSTPAHATLARPRLVSDTLTMFRRSLLHNVRNPTGPILSIVGGMVILLLFVYVFGGTLGAGLIAGGTRSDYLAYIAPAIMLMGAVGIMQMIAVWIAMDMTEGIVARFRTMAIARSSVLAGHAYSGVVLVIIAAAPLLGFAVLLGYRPHADALQWLALAGLIVLIGIALSWLAVAFGIATRRVENASNLPLIVLILPMVSSGFVPVHSFPGWLQGFAQHQPFTPVINTIRGLLAGKTTTSDVLWAIGWLVAVTVVGYAWSLWLYQRRAAGR
jgi:ABC-2 type transport system permease protein